MRKNARVLEVGMRYGLWEITRLNAKPRTARVPEFIETRCDCGTTIIRRKSDWCRTMSCGCLPTKPMVDHIGARFGPLLVQRFVGMQGKGNQLLECLCDCGRKKIKPLYELRRIYSRCTCTRSKPNLAIEQWLDSNGYKFQAEYTFPDCRNVRPLPFDFAIWSNDQLKLVEYQGVYHFKSARGGSKSHLRIKKTDKIKRTYCKGKGYKLLCIPYWEQNLFPLLESFLND